MKTKTLNKKLVFSKKTVAHLNVSELQLVKGGVLSGKTCPFPCLLSLNYSDCCPPPPTECTSNVACSC